MDADKILKQLDDYFKNTPKEEIEAAWKKTEEECAGIESPTIEEYLSMLNELNIMPKKILNQNK